MISHTKNMLIVGIGNPIRSDDGIGSYICEKITTMNMAGVETFCIQQLQIEFIETFSRYDVVMIVDASVNGSDAEITPIQKGPSSIPSSHHMHPQELSSIAELTMNISPEYVLCSVKGINFDFGEDLSETAIRNANTAISLILQWIDKH
jgi:hydrogenase maturation protease